ncbi:probable E3 ubiquitin-protein ligase BAH1-like 1 at C-terminar half [Coccomyxa sp. Obi]|nr:probable E3 ubiquitin-protein ligase BAH1-like 1 at C-terminar half [Coccomyxa sp. Obi]
MKFSSYLKAVEADAPPEWRHKFLNYRLLKKYVKGLSPAECALGECGYPKKSGPGVGCDAEKDAAFFQLLLNEVVKVNREFSKATRKVVARSQGGGSRPRGCFFCFAPPHDPESTTEEIMQQAEWCRRYAQINSVALRKIIKKHDKICKCRSGADFLQDVWCGHRRQYGAFLHSPMLEELKSLQTMLAASAKNGETSVTPSRSVSVQLSSEDGDSEWVELPMLPSLEGGAAIAQHFEVGAAEREAAQPRSGRPSCDGKPVEVAAAVEANEAMVRHALELSHLSVASSGLDDGIENVDNDHSCPICLEAMYQPLGLECGHRFCADCAFSAVGKGNALGTVRAILDHVDVNAACPECRTKGVFMRAIELKETERLIKQRYPKAWAERAEEAHEKEARLRALLAIQRQSALPTIRMPF